MIFVLMLLISILGYSTEIKNGVYYGELRDGSIHEFKIVINNIDSETVQIIYYYRYMYRITDYKQTLNLMMTKKGVGYYAEGKTNKIYIEPRGKETLLLKTDLYSVDEENEIILKRYKEEK